LEPLTRQPCSKASFRDNRRRLDQVHLSVLLQMMA
jgi:hypothetical protein